MKLLRLYFNQRKREIILFSILSLVFLSTFLLYNLPVGAVLYPVFICTVVILLFFIWDIQNVRKKHRILKLISRFPAEAMEGFPTVHTQDDLDYQAIIESLRQEEKELQTDFNKHYQDMVDYYTIWVHQIKTPIAAMRLMLQNEDTTLSRQLMEELQRIEQYVEMVLTYLRLDVNSTDYVFREQPLDPIVKGAIRKFAGQFIRKRIQLNYSPLNILVLTDEKWLTFVIEQVLSNALKYTISGSISIDLEEPSTLCIRDTGIGIAPEDLPRVFEKSYTGYNGRNDKKASGIGLYLCKRICENLGHNITSNSSLESGTVVHIHLDRNNVQVE